jgi:hypothetical protein
VLSTHSSEPLVAEALAVRHKDRVHVIVANLTSQPQRVSVGPFTRPQVQVRLLDAAAAPGASTEPASFRSSGTRRPVESDRVVLSLTPYAVARLDET